MFTTPLHRVSNSTMICSSYNFDGGPKSLLKGTWPPFKFTFNLVIGCALGVGVQTFLILFYVFEVFHKISFKSFNLG